MAIIVFLVDTSASMAQRTCTGGRPTLLDVAKGAVETFLKTRQRMPDYKYDRYMLFTFEEPPHNVKVGWKENLNTFMNELKNLQCGGITNMGASLRHVFDLLNLHRMQGGIDMYGNGRWPQTIEPAVIIVITDGGKLTSATNVQTEFNLPMHAPVFGSELTLEPFRWDQRLFSLVLRLTGTQVNERDTGHVPSDCSPIDVMCEVTGGRSYCVTSSRMLQQCTESLMQKIQHGVVINFEKVGPDPPPVHAMRDGVEVDMEERRPTIAPWHSCRKLIYVPKHTKGVPGCHWPIPESFFPDPSYNTLPPRPAHPTIKFRCANQVSHIIENLPFDKYELEPSPLTQYILARKQHNVCWHVFMPESSKNPEAIYPFGYLKASTNLTCVNLFVLPYNYPMLFPLLDELVKVHKHKMTPEWKANFQNYIRTVPAYYCSFLRKGLEKLGIPKQAILTVIPEVMDGSYNANVCAYLKKLRTQGKIEFEKLCNDMSSKPLMDQNGPEFDKVRVCNRVVLKKNMISHPGLAEKFSHLWDQVCELNSSQCVASIPRSRHQSGAPVGQSYRNPFEIPRKNLLDQVFRMRSNYLQKNSSHIKIQDEDVLHSLPVSHMGNFQEYLKRQHPPLREIEPKPARQNTFGNPFKTIDKRMIIDEADVDLGGGGGGGYPVKKEARDKRKKGPLHRNYKWKRIRLHQNQPGPSPLSKYIPPTPSPTMPALEGERNGFPHDIRPPLFFPPTPSPSTSPFPSPVLAESASSPSYPPPTPTPSDMSGYESGEGDSDFGSVVGDVDSGMEDTKEVVFDEEPAIGGGKWTLTPVQIEEFQAFNKSVKKSIFKEVRRFGNDYSKLFEHVSQLKGPAHLRAPILEEAIKETLRFKRKTLAAELTQISEMLHSEGKRENACVLTNGHS